MALPHHLRLTFTSSSSFSTLCFNRGFINSTSILLSFSSFSSRSFSSQPLPPPPSFESSSSSSSSSRSPHDLAREFRRASGQFTPDFFQPNQNLVARKQEEKLHFVFLEGMTGTAKQVILWRLAKMGLQTRGIPFTTFCLQNGYSPISETASFQWTSSLIDQIQEAAASHQNEPRSFKENIVFFHRSPLSSMIYEKESDRAWVLYLWEEIRKNYNVSVVLCNTESVIMKQRIAERLMVSSPVIQPILASLAEQDGNFQVKQARYDILKNSNILNAVLQTTSSKQGAAALLAMCGIRHFFQNEAPKNVSASTSTPSF